MVHFNLRCTAASRSALLHARSAICNAGLWALNASTLYPDPSGVIDSNALPKLGMSALQGHQVLDPLAREDVQKKMMLEERRTV